MAGGHASVKTTNALGTVMTASLRSTGLTLVANDSTSAPLDVVLEAGDPDIVSADAASGALVVARAGVYLIGCSVTFAAPLGTIDHVIVNISANFDGNPTENQQTVGPYTTATGDSAHIVFESPSRLGAGSISLSVEIVGSADGESISQSLWAVYLGS